VFPLSHHLANHMLARVCAILSFILSLTLVLASLSAPAPNNSSTVAVWPLAEANMSAVKPSGYTWREREAHTP
jgi:propanediol dehydratase small subunit